MYKQTLTIVVCVAWELVCLGISGLWLTGLDPVDILDDGQVVWDVEDFDPAGNYIDFPEYIYDLILQKIGVVAEGSPE